MPHSWCSDYIGSIASWCRYLFPRRHRMTVLSVSKEARDWSHSCPLLPWVSVSTNTKVILSALLLPSSLPLVLPSERKPVGKGFRKMSASPAAHNEMLGGGPGVKRGNRQLSSTASWNIESLRFSSMYILLKYTSKSLLF